METLTAIHEVVQLPNFISSRVFRLELPNDAFPHVRRKLSMCRIETCGNGFTGERLVRVPQD